MSNLLAYLPFGIHDVYQGISYVSALGVQTDTYLTGRSILENMSIGVSEKALFKAGMTPGFFMIANLLPACQVSQS